MSFFLCCQLINHSQFVTIVNCLLGDAKKKLLTILCNSSEGKNVKYVSSDIIMHVGAHTSLFCLEYFVS